MKKLFFGILVLGLLFLTACSDGSAVGKAILAKAEQCIQDKSVQGCNEKLNACFLSSCQDFERETSEYTLCAQRCLDDAVESTSQTADDSSQTADDSSQTADTESAPQKSSAIESLPDKMPAVESSTSEEKTIEKTTTGTGGSGSSYVTTGGSGGKAVSSVADNQDSCLRACEKYEQSSSDYKSFLSRRTNTTVQTNPPLQTQTTSQECITDLACKRTMNDCITADCKTLPALSQELRNCQNDCMTRALSAKKKIILMNLEMCYDGDAASGASQASLLKKATVKGQVSVENPLTVFPGIKAIEGGYSFTDTCFDTARVREGYCYKMAREKQVMGVLELPCPSGTMCSDGACTSTIIASDAIGTEQPRSVQVILRSDNESSKNKFLTLEKENTKVGISSEKSICALRAYQKAFGISQTVGNYTCVGLYKGVPLMRDSNSKLLYGDLQSGRFIGNFYWTNFEKCARRTKSLSTKEAWEEYNSGSKVPKTIEEAEACIDLITSDLSRFEDERCLNT